MKTKKEPLAKKSKTIEMVSNEVLKVKNAINVLKKHIEIDDSFFIPFVEKICNDNNISFEHLKTILAI